MNKTNKAFKEKERVVKDFSDRLIARGVYPGRKKYEYVRPRGLYMLVPSMWRTARRLEQATDTSYKQIMNQYQIAVNKSYLDQLTERRKAR